VFCNVALCHSPLSPSPLEFVDFAMHHPKCSVGSHTSFKLLGFTHGTWSLELGAWMVEAGLRSGSQVQLSFFFFFPFFFFPSSSCNQPF